MRKLFTKANIKEFTAGFLEGVGSVSIVNMIPLPPIAKIGCVIAYKTACYNIEKGERKKAFKKTSTYVELQDSYKKREDARQKRFNAAKA